MISCCGCELSRLNPYDPNGSAYQPPGIDTTFEGDIIAAVYSERYLNYIQQPRYNIYVEAQFVSFPEIQSVQVVFFDSLIFDLNDLSSPGILPFWKGLILDDYFQGISVFEIVGHPPHLIVDLQFLDSTYQSQDFYLARLIEFTPTTNAPALGSISVQRPTFSWNPADEVSYLHTFSLSVSFESKWNVYFTVDSIPSDSVSYQPAGNLLLGSNIWWIALVDEFGNKSLSQEVSFQVSNESNP